MKRRDPHWIHAVYGIIILGLFIALISRDLSQPPTPPGNPIHKTEADQTRNAENQENKTRETLWQRTISDPTAFFTFVLAIFTGVLAVSTFLLWLVTGTAARAARDSADALPILERAYILVGI